MTDSEKQKWAPTLIIAEEKMLIFCFCVCKQTGFVHQKLKDFVKMILTGVLSHLLWFESSHFVKNVIRVELTSFSMWLESNRHHQKWWTWLESNWNHQKWWLELRRVIESIHVITGTYRNIFQVSTVMVLWAKDRAKVYLSLFPSVFLV